MTKRSLTLLVAAVAVAALLLYYFRSYDAPYTALVVDAETGKPVEGAIYLAIWWKASFGRRPWWEGTAPVVDKFAEGVTGADGIVRVSGYWRRRIAMHQNTLTVFKPGFVLWYQEKVFPLYANRTDFDRDRRVVSLKKWDEKMPYSMLGDFVLTVDKGSLSTPPYIDGERLILKAVNEFDKQHKARKKQ